MFKKRVLRNHPETLTSDDHHADLRTTSRHLKAERPPLARLMVKDVFWAGNQLETPGLYICIKINKIIAPNWSNSSLGHTPKISNKRLIPKTNNFLGGDMRNDLFETYLSIHKCDVEFMLGWTVFFNILKCPRCLAEVISWPRQITRHSSSSVRAFQHFQAETGGD